MDVRSPLRRTERTATQGAESIPTKHLKSASSGSCAFDGRVSRSNARGLNFILGSTYKQLTNLSPVAIRYLKHMQFDNKAFTAASEYSSADRRQTVSAAARTATQPDHLGEMIPSLSISLIFGLPALRNTQPGVPPLGVISDYVSFIRAESIVPFLRLSLCGRGSGARVVRKVAAAYSFDAVHH